MSEFNTSTKQTGDIPFDAPEDLTECRCGFFARYAHAHTECCGTMVTFHDGGRELDGTQYYEVEDEFVLCSDCRDVYVCKEHAQYIDEGKPLCGHCAHEREEQMHDDALLENGLANASEDIRDSHKRMLNETDTSRLRGLDVYINILKTQILLLEKARDNKLAAHNAIPFIFGGAV